MVLQGEKYKHLLTYKSTDCSFSFWVSIEYYKILLSNLFWGGHGFRKVLVLEKYMIVKSYGAMGLFVR
jgi:hypothetical protein